LDEQLHAEVLQLTHGVY